MKLASMRIPAAFVAGATIMAWRAHYMAPTSSHVEVEMLGWVGLGGALLVVLGLWELIRAYQRIGTTGLEMKKS